MPPSRRISETDLDLVLGATAGLWAEAKGARFFITGGTGFFGCWLLETWLHANRALGLDMTATVVTRDPARFASKAPHLAQASAVRLIAGPMGDLSGISSRFDYALHAGSENNFDRNVEGTRQLTALVARSGVRKFLFTSSGAVYGTQPPGLALLDESCLLAPDTTDPRSAFAESKRVSEMLCALANSSEAEAKIARCFAVVGPHLPLGINYAIGNFLRDAMAGGPIRIGGDGTPLRSYLYGADLAIWLWTLLFRGRAGHAFNVGSEEPYSILEVAEAVRDIVAPDAEIVIAQQPVLGTLPQRYLPCTQKARTELGLEPTVGFRDAIVRTAEWYRPGKLGAGSGSELLQSIAG
jgi:dTDP-glucose 4,6-dehydratase